MLSFLNPQRLGQFDGNSEKHTGNSSSGVHMLHLPVDQSSAQGKGLLGMLSLNR